nr:type II secretion system protein GspD [Candidatus Omnitrophota bacterium]
EIESAISKLEEKNEVRVFDLQYAKAKEMEEQLKSQIDQKKVGTIKADERSNSVMVQTLPGRMKEVERLIAAFDVKTREVLIDTKIIKVKLSDELQQGIEWEGLASLGKELGMMYLGSTPFGVLQTATTAAATALPTRYQFLNTNYATRGIGSYQNSANSNTNIPVAGSTPVSPGEALHFGLISSKRDIDVFIRYLQTLGNTQVLAAPKLAVINNHEARIHVGERQAYVTSTTTTGQSTSTVSEEVTFVDVGIQLAITPTINKDGFVTMKVKPEVSSVVDTLITNQGNSIPIIDTSMAETTVMVKDGTTIVIGGLRREDKTSADEQIPFLGSLPVVGFLFKKSTGKTERTELLVLMTPHIIEGDKLTIGDDRTFKFPPGKKYENYKDLSADKSLEPLNDIPEEMIKPYSDYMDRAEETKIPAIKGVRR